MNVKGIAKAKILCALYNHTCVAPAAIRFNNAGPTTLSEESAAEIIAEREKEGSGLYFDYLQGHMIKTDISGDVLNLGLYDRDNGAGAGEKAIRSII